MSLFAKQDLFSASFTCRRLIWGRRWSSKGFLAVESSFVKYLELISWRLLSVLRAERTSTLCSRPQFQGQFYQNNTFLMYTLIICTISGNPPPSRPPPQLKQYINGRKYPPCQLGWQSPVTALMRNCYWSAIYSTAKPTLAFRAHWAAQLSAALQHSVAFTHWNK